MSAMSAERLREPEELYFPPDISESKLKKILKGLTREAGREFAGQVLSALKRAQKEGDLRPVNMVVESWYRSLLFLSRPKFEQKWDEADQATGPRLSLDEIRKRRAQRTR